MVAALQVVACTAAGFIPIGLLVGLNFNTQLIPEPWLTTLSYFALGCIPIGFTSGVTLLIWDRKRRPH